MTVGLIDGEITSVHGDLEPVESDVITRQPEVVAPRGRRNVRVLAEASRSTADAKTRWPGSGGVCRQHPGTARSGGESSSPPRGTSMGSFASPGRA